MKILVHDYAGHPFQAELSRALASRGHLVTHGYFAGDGGPKGALSVSDGDPKGLDFVALNTGSPYAKESFLKRHFADAHYGRVVAEFIRASTPDVVISGNTPTRAQAEIVAACKAKNIKLIHWMQDFYSIAVKRLLTRRFGLAGSFAGTYYESLEARQLQAADAIIVITESFEPHVRRMIGAQARDAQDQKVFTIENWGPLGGIDLRDRDNEWTRRHGLAESFNFLYSGTLGLKHNPDLLIALARRTAGRANVVVVGQGVGVATILAAKARHALDNLIVLPVQPYEQFSNVLAAANVAVAMIEPEAGVFSVPSKVQSHLCAGRPILLAAPKENLASQVVRRAEAGVVVNSDDVGAFLDSAYRMMCEPGLLKAMSGNGRDYAVRAYRIDDIADRFERVLTFVIDRSKDVGVCAEPLATSRLSKDF